MATHFLIQELSFLPSFLPAVKPLLESGGRSQTYSTGLDKVHTSLLLQQTNACCTVRRFSYSYYITGSLSLQW